MANAPAPLRPTPKRHGQKAEPKAARESKSKSKSEMELELELKMELELELELELKLVIPITNPYSPGMQAPCVA